MWGKQLKDARASEVRETLPKVPLEPPKSIRPGKGISLHPSPVFPKDPKEFAFAGRARAFSLQPLEKLLLRREPGLPAASGLQAGEQAGEGDNQAKNAGCLKTLWDPGMEEGHEKDTRPNPSRAGGRLAAGHC